MRPFVVCAAIALSLAACESSTGIDLSQQKALAQHETQWNHRDFHSYSFVYDSYNLGFHSTVLLTVRNDVVVSAIDESTGEPFAGDYTWPTIDGVFAVVRDGLNAKGIVVHVDYDSQYGFPVHLSLGARLPNPGGGYGSTITNFQPLE